MPDKNNKNKPMMYSPFADKKGRHVITKGLKQHAPEGIVAEDYSGRMGEPLQAMFSGTIVSQGKAGGYGNRIKIKYDNGYTALFAHLKGFNGFKEGDRINGDTIVGYLGSTGKSTGPHLHFELYDPKGKGVDPNTIFSGLGGKEGYQQNPNLVFSMLNQESKPYVGSLTRKDLDLVLKNIKEWQGEEQGMLKPYNGIPQPELQQPVNVEYNVVDNIGDQLTMAQDVNKTANQIGQGAIQPSSLNPGGNIQKPTFMQKMQQHPIRNGMLMGLGGAAIGGLGGLLSGGGWKGALQGAGMGALGGGLGMGLMAMPSRFGPSRPTIGMMPGQQPWTNPRVGIGDEAYMQGLGYGSNIDPNNLRQGMLLSQGLQKLSSIPNVEGNPYANQPQQNLNPNLLSSINTLPNNNF
jgi:murein DD-endopeptidase MepM/ murein hydrolase activator NlpD